MLANPSAASSASPSGKLQASIERTKAKKADNTGTKNFRFVNTISTS
jgi:hypothetical protein